MTAPLAIEVRDVVKTFRIEQDRANGSLWHQINPFLRLPARRLEVLKGISFDVHQGEFFGVVGRNGSGKSTLMKLLASVYGADAGRIRMAGRLAPFLELGVGFNPQMAARENVVLNGVMMGLSPDEAKSRIDEIIEFAGLSDYTDLPLKNYSSGMTVRLAFSVMVHVDADVMLLDEVLAVGDSEFQEKCEAVFDEWRRVGKTVVLVTHAMQAVNTFCDRAMLIHDGVIEAIGGPLEISNRYIEINMRAAAAARGDETAAYAERFADVIADPPVRIVDVWMLDENGTHGTVVPSGAPIEIRVTAEVLREVEAPGFQFRIDDETGRVLCRGGAADLELPGGRALPGEELEITLHIENPLSAGRYIFAGGVSKLMPSGESEPATPIVPLTFDVTGSETDSLLELEHEISMQRVGAADPSTSPGR